MVNTNLGKIKIKNIKSYHTINNCKIIYILKSNIIPSEIVLIEKHAFGYNKPDDNILITKNHTIFINNRNIPIYNFVNNSSIRLVKNYSNVYNIIMLKNNNIKINNIYLGVICISNKKFKKIKKLAKRGFKELILSIDAQITNLKLRKVKLNLIKFMKFHNIK